jgi:hypothetical protein
VSTRHLLPAFSRNRAARHLAFLSDAALRHFDTFDRVANLTSLIVADA